MRSRAQFARSFRKFPATLPRVLRVVAVLLPLIASAARAEPPAAAAIRVAPKLDLRWQSAAGHASGTELRVRYPATFSQLPDLSSRDYLHLLALPTMGGDGHGVRDQSPTEQLARQVHREGLPLARLWQNEQALVSLGLNRKGKPGLWIIQKTR
jgi:hypothetical protein